MVPPVAQVLQPVVDAVVPPVAQVLTPVVDGVVPPVAQVLSPVVDAWCRRWRRCCRRWSTAVVPPVAQVLSPVVDAVVPPVAQVLSPVRGRGGAAGGAGAVAGASTAVVPPVSQVLSPVLDACCRRWRRCCLRWSTRWCRRWPVFRRSWGAVGPGVPDGVRRLAERGDGPGGGPVTVRRRPRPAGPAPAGRGVPAIGDALLCLAAGGGAGLPAPAEAPVARVGSASGRPRGARVERRVVRVLSALAPVALPFDPATLAGVTRPGGGASGGMTPADGVDLSPGVPTTTTAGGSGAGGGFGGGWSGGWAAVLLAFAALGSLAWRRLILVPVAWRPVPFIALLDRPG